MLPVKRIRWSLLLLFAVCGAAQFSSPLPFFRVTVGEPSIWSMEQAHYLLARMSARSQGLVAPLPKDSDMDVTAANGLRYTALRTLLGVSAGYDANLSLPNQIAGQRMVQDNQRRTDLQAQLDKLNKDQINSVQQIAALTVQQAQVPAGADGDALKKKLQAQIDPLNVQQTAQQARIDQINKELTTLSAAPTTLSLPTAPTPSPNGNFTLPDPAIKMLKDNGISVDGGKLNVSAVIDAFVQLDQELIMKQVTLLRDEVGKDRRVVFLELPASFYPVSGKADDYIAQVQWRVAGFTESTLSAGAQNRDDIVQWAKDAVVERTKRVTKPPQPPKDNPPAPAGVAQPPGPPKDMNPAPLPPAGTPAKGIITESSSAEQNTQGTPAPVGRLGLRYTPVKSSAAAKIVEEASGGQAAGPEVRTLELVPQVSALNVSDRHDISHGINLGGVFRFLTGIGVQVSYQRQRQLYESFMQQETFASAYGKGEPEFGWTFGPKPGTTSVSPGIRTAYAILSIPARTETLTIEGRGCAFKRGANPPQSIEQVDTGCGPIQQMILVVPQNRDNGFNVTNSVEYTPVFAGQRATLTVYGDYFSRLTGVLVNGVPLRRDISIGDPSMTPPVPAPPTGTQNPAPAPSYGEFEVLNSNSLVLAFAMPADYTGTPDVTLVAPAAVQRLDLQPAARTNGPMFRAIPEVSAAKFYPGPEELNIEIAGKGFADDTHVRINGIEVPALRLSSELLAVTIAKPAGSEQAQLRSQLRSVTLDIRALSAGVPQTDRQAGLSMPNPILPTLTLCELQPAVEHAKERVIKLTGTNLSPGITTKGFYRLSATDGLLLYDASEPERIVVGLKEGFLDLETGCLVTKPAPKPAPNPAPNPGNSDVPKKKPAAAPVR